MARIKVVIIVKAAFVEQANQWLREKLKATGDNIGVPLILKTDADDQAPRAYGTSWEGFLPLHADRVRDEVETVQNQIEAGRVVVRRNQDFFTVIDELGLRVKPSEPMI